MWWKTLPGRLRKLTRIELNRIRRAAVDLADVAVHKQLDADRAVMDSQYAWSRYFEAEAELRHDNHGEGLDEV